MHSNRTNSRKVDTTFPFLRFETLTVLQVQNKANKNRFLIILICKTGYMLYGQNQG